MPRSSPRPQHPPRRVRPVPAPRAAARLAGAPHLLGALALAGLLLGTVGCTAPAGAPGGTAAAGRRGRQVAPPATNARYKTVADLVGFYRFGPAQPNGPDQRLTRSTHLLVVRRGFGYSQVELEGGDRGMVANEDIAPLTPTEISAENARLTAANAPLSPSGAAVSYPTGPAAGRGARRPARTVYPRPPDNEISLPTATVEPDPVPPPTAGGSAAKPLPPPPDP